MGKDEALSHLRAISTLTRLKVMTGRLGIDAPFLTSRAPELVPSLDRYARVWLDADFRRIALRTLAPAPVLARPGISYVELESIPSFPESVETALVVGSHPLEGDLRALADGGVDRSVVDDLAGKLQMLGSQASELLGRRTIPGDQHWLLGVGVGADSVGEVSRLTDAFGVSPFQLAMLGQVHPELAAHGCLVTVACTTGAIRELAFEYRDVAWPRVIWLTDRLRSITSAAPYGAFAGAFNADNAARVEITLRPEQKAGVRVAVEDAAE